MKIKYLTSSLLFLTFFVYSSWAKPSSGPSAGIEELFPGKLLDSDGKEVSKDALAGKTVGIYFSAHWCPPCKQFTPMFASDWVSVWLCRLAYFDS